MGATTTVYEAAELLKKFLPEARFDIGPGYLPAWDRQVEFDLTRSARDLGYVPDWPLTKGLEAQIEWIRKGMSNG